MALLILLLIIAAYDGLGTFALCKVFPDAKPGMLAIAVTVSNALAFGGVVFNGIFPPMPLKPPDMLGFLVMSFLGLTFANTFFLKHSLDRSGVDYVTALVVSAALNLGLLILLGVPCFYALIAATEMLFVTKPG